jgi:hypothetical protein
MMLKFVHEFEDDPRGSDFDIDLDLPEGAALKFDITMAMKYGSRRTA